MYDRKKFRSAQNVTDVSFFCSVGALVQQRDGETSGIWIVDKGICNLKL